MNTQKIVVAVFLVAILYGCMGCSANGHSFQPVTCTPSEAVVYIYRPSGSYCGSGVGLTVECDGEKVGVLWNKGYLYKIIHPGKHIVSSKTEQNSEVPFEAKAGESYYIVAEVEMGYFIGRPKLIMVPSDDGKLAILGMKYSEQF